MRTSEFSKKIQTGQMPSDAEWEDHLLIAHTEDPRMTPAAFGHGKTKDGKNSYQVLASDLSGLAGDATILDLGCGDGHLIRELLPHMSSKSRVAGLDMAPEALDLARAEILDPRVSFMQARAQELPFPDHSFDYVFSHMAFMLMAPIEPVVNEIRRVLKPGGWFAAVTGSGTAEGLYKQARRLIAMFVQAHIPKYMEARASRADETVFAAGFGLQPEVHELQMEFAVSPEGLWHYAEGMYFMAVLPESAKRELKDELMALARDHVNAEGKIRFFVPIRKFRVQALS